MNVMLELRLGKYSRNCNYQKISFYLHFRENQRQIKFGISKWPMQLVSSSNKMMSFSKMSKFSFTGEHWKTTRSTFSPIFTSGKMKGMMALINEVNKKLLESFETEAE